MTRKITLFKPWLIFGIAFIAFNCSQPKETASEGESSPVEETTEEKKEEAPQIASPRQQAQGQVGEVSIRVDYGSPAVKGREIWGGLEAYGKVWRAGANETTSIEFTGDVMIGDTKIAAGKYGFYLVPSENEDWVAIINTDWSREEHGAWGAYNYNESNDIVRVTVSPEWVEDVQERLQYAVGETGITLAWEKVRLTLPVKAANDA